MSSPQLYLAMLPSTQDPTTSSPSSGQNNPKNVDFLQKKLLPFLLAVTLVLKGPTLASEYLEKATGLDPNTSLLSRALILVQTRQHKAFKRDLMGGNGAAPDQGTPAYVAFEFIRANLEILKVQFVGASAFAVLPKC